jgi:hypothetical protein
MGPFRVYGALYIFIRKSILHASHIFVLRKTISSVWFVYGIRYAFRTTVILPLSIINWVFFIVEIFCFLVGKNGPWNVYMIIILWKFNIFPFSDNTGITRYTSHTYRIVRRFSGFYFVVFFIIYYHATNSIEKTTSWEATSCSASQ